LLLLVVRRCPTAEISSARGLCLRAAAAARELVALGMMGKFLLSACPKPRECVNSSDCSELVHDNLLVSCV
jgi:hypothetical protein